ncbi:MAG: hypothetical protein OXU43_07170 [Gammaproteobacteria bacterium]|nr:hypothetical protein [Gammaproteobacteria bacterium]
MPLSVEKKKNKTKSISHSKEKPQGNLAEITRKLHRWRLFQVVASVGVSIGFTLVALSITVVTVDIDINLQGAKIVFDSDSFLISALIVILFLGTAFMGAVLAGICLFNVLRNKIRYFGDSKIELEKKLDPNRTSSNLTKSGETNPEDWGPDP